MAKPSFLPAKKTTVQRLFAEMPRSFSDDPQSIPCLNIRAFIFDSDYNTTSSNISLIISDGLLTINSLLPYIFSETIILSNYTINNLILYFNTKYINYGIQAQLNEKTLYSQGNISASTLLEGIYDLKTYSPNNVSSLFTEIDRFTSTNYALLMTIALGLIDNEKNMHSSLMQTDLRLSQNKWLDYWGRQLSITRQGDESDFDEIYRNRIQSQITQQKSNNIALEYFIYSSTGRESSVVDGGRPMLLAGSALISGIPTGIIGTALPQVGGSGLRVNITASSGSITNISIYTAGMGYNHGISGSNTVIFTVNGGTTLAQCSVSVSNGVPYGSITIISGGSGYSTSTNVLTTQTNGTNNTTYDTSYRIGPTTGAGSFIVYILLKDGETALPQPLYSSLLQLINKWKPAGIPFVIKSTNGI